MGEIEDEGLKKVNWGVMKKNEMRYYEMGEKEKRIMVKGRNIKDDRKGMKLYRREGEIEKDDEEEISEEYRKMNEIIDERKNVG